MFSFVRHRTNPNTRSALAAGGVVCALLLPLLVLQRLAGLDVFAIPFVASAAGIAFAPTAPLARPRAIVLGYVVATLIAFVLTASSGPSMYAAAVAAVLSIVVMVLLKAPHLPAVAASAMITLTDPGMTYLLDPLLPAVIALVATPLLLGRLGFRYPTSGR